ncbi:uncharacterized protein [Medicago truncatula]|uniref:uncharacterized protein n=1 Tax=Medicago truncatula TaxID=3880 RepID=UPI001967218D|nr:uncharacterized protein LOC120576858 [Medicago truncatula]
MASFGSRNAKLEINGRLMRFCSWSARLFLLCHSSAVMLICTGVFAVVRMVCVSEVGIGSSCLSVVRYTTVGEILLCNRGVVESTYIRTFVGILRCLGSNYSSIWCDVNWLE